MTLKRLREVRQRKDVGSTAQKRQSMQGAIRIASNSAGAVQSGVTVVVVSLQMSYDGFYSNCSCARGERLLKGPAVIILGAQAQADWEERCWSLNSPRVPSASLEGAEEAPDVALAEAVPITHRD